jgi:hypothetical protein
METAVSQRAKLLLEQIGRAAFTPLSRHANFSFRTADPIAPGGRAID